MRLENNSGSSDQQIQWTLSGDDESEDDRRQTTDKSTTEVMVFPETALVSKFGTSRYEDNLKIEEFKSGDECKRDLWKQMEMKCAPTVIAASSDDSDD